MAVVEALVEEVNAIDVVEDDQDEKVEPEAGVAEIVSPLPALIQTDEPCRGEVVPHPLGLAAIMT